MNEAIKFILERNLDSSSKTYMNVFAYDDKKKDKKTQNHFYELTKESIDKIIDECYFYNIGTFGTFININPLNNNKRKKEFIKKINFVFIDLDAAKEEDLETVKSYLEQKGFFISYIGQSGSGYHLLLEVDYKPENEIKVKNFLKYLHTHVSPKVDTSTGDNTRLMRIPESEHNKKEPFKLKTLKINNAKENEIKLNSEIVGSLQLKENKDITNMNYLKEIKKQDVFFSNILSKTNSWKTYIKYLNNSTMRNDNFMKNLGIFLSYNYKYISQANAFIENWEPQRNKALGGWIKKAKEQGMIVNYYELLKWSKENGSEEFTELLSEQTKETFLDDYEIYYLEEEKPENNCLLFYPEKNYYLQKSIYEVILNIYYNSKEKGLNLVKELNLDSLYDKWKEFNFKKQMSLILDQLRRILEQENRIKLIYNINYQPTEEKFITLDNKRFFNIYKKSNLMEMKITEIEEYDFRHIKELIMNLCENNKEYYNWFIQWLAFQIQNPTSKLPTAVIFQGEQGTGKGVLKTQVLDSIFGSNCQEINQTHLESSFNEYLLAKQIIVANEVMHNENRQTLPNILKNLVTDEYITIQRKFRKELVIRNYTHWIFCTNSDNPIKIEDGDRRYSVFKSNKLNGGGKNAQLFVKSLIDNKEHELPHFLVYLKQLEVDEFLVSNPIETDAKNDIVDLNKSSLERFITYIREFENLKLASESLFNGKYTYFTEDTIDGMALSSELFYLIYESYCSKFNERGVFNKLTFSKKIRKFNIETTTRYFKSRKKSIKSIIEENIIDLTTEV